MHKPYHSGRGLPQSKTGRKSRSVLECGRPLPLFLIGLLLLAGCSSFNCDWKRAGQQPPATNQLAGRWQGHWMSDRNGHNGRLRCLLSQTGESAYEARFHAKYWKILSFSYTVPLKVQRSNEVYQFAGEANLGKLAGGVYRYSGKVAGTNFHSTYRSKYDYGYFRMNRVP
jgi:hypothetical protein